jgi:hypothetical protein
MLADALRTGWSIQVLLPFTSRSLRSHHSGSHDGSCIGRYGDDWAKHSSCCKEAERGLEGTHNEAPRLLDLKPDLIRLTDS